MYTCCSLTLLILTVFIIIKIFFPPNLLMSCTAMTTIIQAFICIIFSGSLEADQTVIEQIPRVYKKRE